MTDPQHARWLELVEARAYRKHDNSFEMTETEAFALCAAIAEEAVAAERKRLGLDGEAVELTDEEITAIWASTLKKAYTPKHTPILEFARALLASQRDRERLAERERCARWKPINHDARSGKRMLVLVRQPVPTFGGGGIFIARWTDRICDRGEDRGRAWFNDADQEIRLDVTHWMPLPDGPSAAAHREGEGE